MDHLFGVWQHADWLEWFLKTPLRSVQQAMAQIARRRP